MKNGGHICEKCMRNRLRLPRGVIHYEFLTVIGNVICSQLDHTRSNIPVTGLRYG